MQTFGEWFGKYIGVQGVMGVALVGGYIYMSTAALPVADDYKSLMTLVLGFYFAKNGVSMLEKLKEVFSAAHTAPSARKR